VVRGKLANFVWHGFTVAERAVKRRDIVAEDSAPMLAEYPSQFPRICKTIILSVSTSCCRGSMLE
jgi:hypothetical protein